MRRHLFQAIALLAVAALAGAPRPASAVNTGCPNVTGDCYCNATEAISGFITHLNRFAFSGFLSATSLQCLEAFALTAEANLGSSLTTGENQLIFLVNQLLSLSGGGQLPLPVNLTTYVAALLGNPPAPPLPPLGTTLSNCLISFRCPVGLILPGEICLLVEPLLSSCFILPPGTPSFVFATMSAPCETLRREAAEILASDLLCAIQLAAAGHVSDNTPCTCPSFPP